MTVDEALAMVRQTKECWIVFNSKTGEVLSVVGEQPDETVRDSFRRLWTLPRFNQPVMRRHFQSAAVTREVLEGEQDRAERGRAWGRVLTAWASATTEELLQIVERGQYDHSGIIVADLWILRRDELSLSACERLSTLLCSAVLCEADRNRLRIYLAALGGDEGHLKAIWKRSAPGRACWSDIFALMDAFAHVRTKDQEIIGDMLGFFDLNVPFGVKFNTMIALGKMGSIAGPRAAAAIRRTMYNTAPGNDAARERVLERLVSAEDDWTICGECCYGRVQEVERHGDHACPVCLGLGFRRAVFPDTTYRGPIEV